MPTYDYECDACGHKFELFQQISAEPQKKCPKCKKSKLRRLFGTGAALMFKGSGFYTTDYRSESYKKASAADKKSTDSGTSSSESTTQSDAKSSAKSEAKPEAKSEAKSESKSTGGSKPRKKE